jgi:hypothetical protein
VSIIQETFYAVKCDRCGETHQNYDDTQFWSEPGTAIEQAYDSEWIEKDGKHYCPNCFVIDEVTDEETVKPPYPEHLVKLRKFIEKILKSIDETEEFEDHFKVSFQIREKSFRENMKQLPLCDENYILNLLQDNLVELGYKVKESYSGANAECVIIVKK